MRDYSDISTKLFALAVFIYGKYLNNLLPIAAVGENPPPASTACPGFTQEIRGFFITLLTGKIHET
jgi:hypothetical protein